MIKLLDILSEIKINEPPSFDSKTVISQITQAFEEAENNDERIEKIEDVIRNNGWKNIKTNGGVNNWLKTLPYSKLAKISTEIINIT